jgi:hypothetical protein
MIHCNRIANVDIHISWRTIVLQKMEGEMIGSEGMHHRREIATDALKGKDDQIRELDDRG